MTRAISTLLAATLVLATAPRATADDVAAAAKFFAEGKSAYARGDNRAAALAFEEAYRRAPRGAAIFNAATAWDAAGDPPRAADDYALAIASSDLDDAKKKEATTQLAKLEAQLGRISITGPSSARVNVAHVIDGTLPLVVHVRPGAHEIRAQFAGGKSEARTVKVDGGAIENVVFEEKAAAATPVVTAQATPTPPPAEPVETSHPARAWGFVSLGAGALFGGTAVFLGVRALSARDDYDASGHRDAAARDRASQLRTWANVSWAAAGTFAALGVVLIALPGSSPSRPTVGLVPARDGGELSFSARF